ncbi:MAG: FAD-dependent oxidoreductase, partial [Bacteroidota bacterium]
KAAELSAKGKDMITDILAELDSIYAGQATPFVRRSLVTNEIMYIIQDWSKEKYIGGGYSYPKASAKISDREALGNPVNNTLFFAGEATDISGEAGTLNGALMSAERATTQLIESILAVS